MDVTSLIISVDTSAAATNLGKLQASAQATSNVFIQMGSDIDSASSKSTQSLSAFTVAAGQLIADLVKEVIQLGVELGKIAFDDTIRSGLEFDDMIRKATVSMAALIQASDPGKFSEFSSAMAVSGEVIEELRKKMIAYHVPLEDLVSTQRAVMTATAAYGLTLQQQINLTAQFSSALQGLGISGLQASRDIRDILSNRANRVMAGQILFNPQQLADLDNAATSYAQKLQIITDATAKWQQAGLHANEVLSFSFATLESQIQSSLGSVVQPLYDNLVEQVNRVREVIGSTDFAGYLKPLVDGLNQATTYAGNLATALASNQTDKFKDLLVAGFDVAVDEMFVALDDGINKLFEPAFQNAMLTALGSFGETLIDLALRFGAEIQAGLATALQKSGFQSIIEQEMYRVKGGDMTDAPKEQDYFQGGSKYNPNATGANWMGALSTGDANIEQYKKDRQAWADKKLGTEYSPNRDWNDIYNEKKAQGNSAISGWDSMVQQRTGITGAAGINNNANAQQQLEADKAKLSGIYTDITSAAQLVKDQAFVQSHLPHDQNQDLNAKAPVGPNDETDKQLKAQISAQLEADKQNLMEKQSTSDKAAIASAQDLVKVDEYRKLILEQIENGQIKSSQEQIDARQRLADFDKATAQYTRDQGAPTGTVEDQQKRATDALAIEERRKELLAQIPSTYDIINEKAEVYAKNLNAHTQQILEQKGLLDQINAAEKAASEAAKNTATIKSNPFQTDLQKRPQLLASYAEEIADLQRVITLNQQAIDTGAYKDQAALAQRQKEIAEAKNKIVGLQTQSALQTDSGQFMADFVKFENSLGTMGSQAAQVVTGTLGSAINTVTQNINAAINGTETWGQAFQKIGTDILSTLEQLIIKMMVTQALQAALGAVGGGVGSMGATAIGGVMASGMHQGGIVGTDSSFTRQLPRYHSGGLAENEHVAILQRGERVQTKNQQKQEKQQAPQQPIHVHIAHFSDPNEIRNYITQNPDVIITALGRSPGMTKQLSRRG